MASPSQELFSTTLRVAKLPSKHYKNSARVGSNWDVNAGYLTGTFKIPLQTDINPNTGKHTVTAQDFTQPEQTTSPQGIETATLLGITK